MASRLNLQLKLENYCNNVYFQPPESVKLVYPCIIYKLDGINSTYADDNPYTLERSYQITYVDRNPDAVVPEKLLLLPKTRFSNQFVSDNLYHWVIEIYY